MSDLRKATVDDCTGCREAWRNKTDKPCWSLPMARIVPMYRSERKGHMVAVEMPHCFTHPGWRHCPRVVLPEAQA